MSLSWVTAIDVKNDNAITLHIKVGGFEKSYPVEISGSVTQENGAVATFYEVQEMPDVDGPATMHVEDIRSASLAFAANLPFTVVARAADVWISTLKVPQEISGIKARWNSSEEDYYTALTPTKKAEPYK